MDDERLIPEGTVLGLWRVSDCSGYHWRKQGLLLPDEQMRARNGTVSAFYYPSTINAFIVWSAKNFGKFVVPTFDELLAAPQPALLTSREAAKMRSTTLHGIRAQFRQGYLPALQVRRLRFPASILADLYDDELIDTSLLTRLLCESDDRVEREELDRIKQKGKGNKKFTTWQNVETLLEERLPAYVSPKTWRAICLRPGETMTSGAEIKRRYRLPWSTFLYLLQRSETPYIKRRDGATFIPTSAAESMVAAYLQLAPEVIGSVLAVPLQTATQWIKDRELCQQNHVSTARTCPNRECLMAYIASRRTADTFTPEDWLNWCLRDNAPPISGEELVESTVGLSWTDLRRTIADGALRGVWLPGEDWRQVALMRSDAIRFSRRWELRISR